MAIYYTEVACTSLWDLPYWLAYRDFSSRDLTELMYRVARVVAGVGCKLSQYSVDAARYSMLFRIADQAALSGTTLRASIVTSTQQLYIAVVHQISSVPALLLLVTR